MPIQVPGFRGLEPELRLVYDYNRSTSSGHYRAGQLGIGWLLEGFTDIVRFLPIGGAPRFDVSDTYWLGRKQLEICVSPMIAASCLADNNFAASDAYATCYESFH